MKAIIIVSALVAVAAASPALFAAQSQVRSQYHSQDGLGQYSYGYNGDLSSKAESRSLDGVTHGSYSFVDSNGQLQTVQYTADDVNGFRAAATNLPRAPLDNAIPPSPVVDTAEVQIAKAEHYRAYNEAAARAAASPDLENSISVAAPVFAQAPVFAPAVPAFASAVPAFAQAAPAFVAVRTAEDPASSFSYTTTINGNAIAAPSLPRGTLFAAGPLVASAPVQFAYGDGPQDEPAVAAAKAQHLAAVEEQKARIAAASH